MTINFIYENNKHEVSTTDSIHNVPTNSNFIWCDCINPNENEKQFLFEHFKMDKHKIEESIYTISRPKFGVDEKDKNKYFVLHAIKDQDFSANPISITTFNNNVVTVHQNNIDVIDHIIKSIKNHELETNAETITLEIIDGITKNYFNYIDDVEDTVFSFEYQNVNSLQNKNLMNEVFDIRAEIIKLKRVLLPMEQLLEDIIESNTFSEKEHRFNLVKRIQNRIKKQNDTLNASEEMTDEIKDNNQSYRANRINNVMNVLTIISSIFFPLSLLTGWFGMNFSYMPELEWKYSYFVFIIAMAILTVWLILLFKKKKWF